MTKKNWKEIIETYGFNMIYMKLNLKKVLRYNLFGVCVCAKLNFFYKKSSNKFWVLASLLVYCVWNFTKEKIY